MEKYNDSGFILGCNEYWRPCVGVGMFRFLGRVLSSTCFSFGLSSATGSIWYTTRKHKLVPSIFQSATCPFTQNVLFDYYNSAFTKKAEYLRGEKNWFLEIELGRVCPNL